MFYWLVKHIFLGPLLKLLYRPKARGLENVPADGPVILAANHVSFMDSLFIPLVLKRRVVYLGKSDYFDHARTRWFFKMVNVIPVFRFVISWASAISRSTLRGTRQSLLPVNRMRTLRSLSSSRRLFSSRRLKYMRYLISPGGRFQFSVEKA